MDAVVPATVAIPLGSAAILALFGHWLPRRVVDVLALLAAAATTACCVVVLHDARAHDVVYWFGGWQPRPGVVVGIDFAIDPLGAGVAALAGFLVTAALGFSWHYFESIRAIYHSLMLIFLAAMVGFALAGDLFNLFVWFELMSVVAFGLTAYKSEERGAIQGGVNFAVTNTIAGFFVLFALGLLYGRTGTLNFALMGRVLAQRPPDGLVVVAFGFLAGGFLVKGAVVPFHFWLADAHAVAPTPVCILFSGVMVELGLYAVARVYWSVFSGALLPSDALRTVLVGFGVATVVLGAVFCLAQHHLKRLLALSTVCHAGIILIGIGLLSHTGLAGAGVYVVGHGLVKGALFACAGILLHRKNAVDDNQLHGRARDMPLTAVLWFAGGLALAGMPPFGTYLGKGLIEDGAREWHATWLVAVVIFGSAMTGAAVLRAGAQVFLGWGAVERDTTSEQQGKEEDEETSGSHHRTPIGMLTATAALLLASLALGVAPHLAHQAQSDASRFLDRNGTTAFVLEHRLPPVVHLPGPPPEPSPSMLAYGFLSAAIAIGIAGVAIIRESLPRRVVALATRYMKPPLMTLRRLQTGHVGDYVAWSTFGMALLTGFLALATRHA